MKKRICAVLIAATAAFALCACGSEEEKKSGTTEVKSTVTTAPATSTSTEPASSTTDSSSTADSTADSSTTEPTEPAALGSFTAESLTVFYQGTKVELGAKVSDLKDALGAESAPVSEGANCLSGETTRVYTYAGMQLTAKQDDTIIQISIANYDYPGEDVMTKDGLMVGYDYAMIKSALGEPNETSGETTYIYSAGDSKKMKIKEDFDAPGKIGSIAVYDENEIGG